MVGEVIREVSRDFGIGKHDRPLLVPAVSPGTALLPQRTLESYGIGSGTTLVLAMVGAAGTRYRPGAHSNSTADDAPDRA
jgi:hypothetical protein